MAEVVIATDQLTKKFGDFTAVNQVTFTMEVGEVVGYLGPNGSGKTTTLRLLLGLLLPTSGSIQVLGYNPVNQAEMIRQRVGYMSQQFGLYDDLTVWENIVFYAGVYGILEPPHLENTLARVDALGIKDEMVGDLPVGWRQRLSLAVAIVHQPRLIILDEPTSGVDPTARRMFWELIYTLLDEGMTVFVTTHYMDEAEYCQKVGIMREGRLLSLDTPHRLRGEGFKAKVWNIQLGDTLGGLSTLEKDPEVLRVSLAAGSIRVITSQKMTPKKLASRLKGAKLEGFQVESTDPNLEDVFINLARG
jgi:ABC-2 type transport system ATP-binding protein